ncbi:MAG: helix-turn-helix transcriptional regulator [Bacteroidota bacterium]
MYFSFGPKSVALLLFFSFGILFSILLLGKYLRHQQKSSAWLSGFVFLCAMYLVPWMCGYANWYAQDGYSEILFFIPFQHLFLIGPFIWFYTQSLLLSGRRIKAVEHLHFLPACLYLLYSLVMFVWDQWLGDAPFFYADQRDRDLDQWYQLCGGLSMLAYTLLSLRLYLRYSKRIYETISYADEVVYHWIKRFLLSLALILIFRIVLFIEQPQWGEFGAKFWYYVLFGGLAGYIGLAGYGHAIREAILRSGVKQMHLVPHDIIHQAEENATSLAEADKAIWKDRIQDLMQAEKLAYNPGLTLRELADKLSTNPRQISQVINQGFGMNFNDFVNQYRLEAVKDAFERNEHEQHSILGIALTYGFNSKTTFNRVFKKETGMTPKQYLMQKKSAKS